MIVDDLAPLATPVDHLAQLTGNPRRGDVDAVARSLGAFGQRKPIVANRRTGEVIAGNHTLQAARQLGWDSIAVVWVDDDPTTASAYALADNRTAELGSYDEPALAALISQVHDADLDLLAATGWDGDDLQDLLDRLEPARIPLAGGDPDDVPPPPPPKTIPGDVWLLGPHRLVCGDCEAALDDIDPAGVALLLSDPPYGVSERTDRASKGRGINPAAPGGMRLSRAKDFAPVHGDDQPFDPTHLFRFKRLVLFGANYYAERLPPSPSWIVWDKLDGLSTDKREIGFDDNADVELAWTNLGGPARIIPHRWKGIVKASEHGQSRVHPTQKPVELMVRIIDWRTQRDDVVLDPYAGSGSTLMAAEMTGRSCVAVEYEPTYCDVICRRYQEATGTAPIAEATGNAHDFTEGS